METNKTTKAINEYQTQKTIRFGLTVTNNNLYSENIVKLLKCSEEKIKEQLKKTQTDDLQNQRLRCCLIEIKEYLKTWNNVFSQIDFLAITKDYYKVLSRKAKFDYDKGNGSEIKLSSLQSKQSKYNDKKRYQYILDFWHENFIKVENLYRKSDDLLKVFEEAANQNQDDKKLNKVDLRKTFLSLFNLVNETLKPLIEGNLFIVNDDKIDEHNSKHNFVSDFIVKTEERKQLHDCITDLQDLFKANGGYVPFGRATINKWTALQKSNHKDDEIKRIIRELKIENISMQNIDYKYKYDSFAENFKQIYNKEGEKVWVLQFDANSVIKVCQYFKYKKVPINARLNIAERLIKEKSWQREKKNDFLSEFGISKSPALDYKNDKENFNLANYPLKVAFDYAWENCAKAIYETTTFPKEHCEKYLKEVFDLDIANNACFTKYALLLRFKILICRIKSEETTQIQNIEAVRGILDEINKNISGRQDFSKAKIITEINNWLSFKEKQTDKKEKYSNQDNFSLAMQIIGQERGGLKSRIEKYKTLTDMFKVCASKFGKQFADLREYFQEAYEVDKIKYRAWIIEDEKQNRFVLFANKEREIDLTSEEGNLYFYEVKSLTSKSLVKFIKNRGAYADFHKLKNNFNYEKIKRDWQYYKNDKYFIQNLKDALRNSKMAIDQNWAEFKFDFTKFNTYEDIEKEIDRKGYKLVCKTVSLNTLKDFVENKGCLLLPIINQDINKDDKQAKNQFTKDWNSIYDNKKRLHPEFNLFYRFPTQDYPNTKFSNGTEKTKRYSRFQMLAHFGCESVPKGDYLSKKEQIAIFNDDAKQKDAVEKFNNSIASDFEYIIGIDRGIKQLATLCVLNKNGQIQGDFEIYTRTFENKQWKHTLSEKRNILDLSNLRVETTIDGNKVLVDLASITTKNGENQQKIKLKQLAYIRELQYSMQTRRDDLLDFAKGLQSADDILKDIRNFIVPFKEGGQYADLPNERIYNLLKEWRDADDEAKRKIAELDPAQDLKSGIVANMIGVVAFLCEKYGYKVRISLEDLTRAFGIQKDALSGIAIAPNDEDFKEQENRRLAGVGTYQFFEMQLLKKLFKTQVDKNLHLVPAFRSVDNYEKIVRRDKKTNGDEYVNYPFGIVRFIDPKYTSKRCPKCGKTDVNRNQKTNIVKCNNCEYETKAGNSSEANNIHFITDGDQNGAYHIAQKALKIQKEQ
ncbi:hypothetical protein AGMMS50239_03340 [Bacteroidia bacterium]|nr:hypothetical protein AGMMS50239_03340 [Bacteroidia bacterium]